MDSLKNRIKNTFFLRAYATLKIPLLAWISPTLIEVGKSRTELKVPLQRRTKNHLGVMYFGALAMGAEAAVAIKAVKAIHDSGHKIDFLFKDFQAQFHKRAEGDVHFICDQGPEVEALIQKCLASGIRETQTFESYALVPKISESERVASFSISLSVKLRGPRPTNLEV